MTCDISSENNSSENNSSGNNTRSSSSKEKQVFQQEQRETSVSAGAHNSCVASEQDSGRRFVATPPASAAGIRAEDLSGYECYPGSLSPAAQH